MSGEFAGGQEELTGTSEQLRAYIDEWFAGLDEQSRQVMDSPVAFGRKLAERIDDRVVPAGFVMAAEVLVYDCIKGVDSFTGKPLPREFTGYSGIVYKVFRVQADLFAKGAFSDQFFDEVTAIRESFGRENTSSNL